MYSIPDISGLADAELVDRLALESCRGCEYDNREAIEACTAELKRRLVTVAIPRDRQQARPMQMFQRYLRGLPSDDARREALHDLNFCFDCGRERTEKYRVHRCTCTMDD